MFLQLLVASRHIVTKIFGLYNNQNNTNYNYSSAIEVDFENLKKNGQFLLDIGSLCEKWRIALMFGAYRNADL